MKKKLSRVAPLQLGIVLGVLYGILSLIIVVPMGLLVAGASAVGNSSSSNPGLFGAAAGGFMLILMPFLYAVLGFVGGIIAAAVYNLVAKITGGIEFTVTDEA